mmetsp:Transcript_9279/g.22120  ORF Transcript_9279/g.22120 Transcript_9279/m.22120 type:complete len:243 (-) Transcript_9279:125-853(-)
MASSPRRGGTKDRRAQLSRELVRALETKDATKLTPTQEREAELALSIRSDGRFKQIDAFSQKMKAVPLPHVALASIGPRPHTSAGGEGDRLDRSGDIGTASISPSSARTPAPHHPEGKGAAMPGVNLQQLTGEDRCKVPKAIWQDSVDRSIKRLMLDFDLTDEPSCRLNHLDRMHDWFVRHGPKRKAPQRVDVGPNYLIAERRGREPPPAGSTMLVSGVLSPTSELMSNLYSPRFARPATRG